MRLALGSGVVGALTLGLLPLAAAADLEPVSVPAFHNGLVQASADGKAARKLAKEPEYKSTKPLYLKIELGSGEERFIIGALDESKGTGTGYDTIHLDANNNLDLTDDPKVDAQKTPANAQMVQFQVPSAKLTVKYQQAQPRELPVNLFIYGYKARGAAADLTWMVRISVLQSLQARLDIGDRQVLVRVVDGFSWTAPGNGCFNDFGVDRLRIDLNGDGKIDPQSEDLPLSKVFAFGGRLWDLSLDAAGRNLVVKPSEAPVGQVKLAMGLTEGAAVTGGRLVVSTKDGLSFALDPGSREAQPVAQGTYALAEGTILLTDKAGNKWNCQLARGAEPVLKVGGTAEIKLGAPFTVEPVLQGALQPGGTVQVSHRLVGAAGEAYGSVTPVGKGQPPAPQVSISDASGGPVTSGKMEYG